MKNIRHILLIFAIFAFGLFGCEKNNFAPENYFETNINNQEFNFEPQTAIISKGITIIGAHETKDNSKKAIVISINGDRIGNYKQTFDYKTGVSVSQCGLGYKILSKSEETMPNFYTSYEGNVKISEIDRKNKNISGSYNFKLYSIPNNNKSYIINGTFIKLDYK